MVDPKWIPVLEAAPQSLIMWLGLHCIIVRFDDNHNVIKVLGPLEDVHFEDFKNAVEGMNSNTEDA